MRINSKLKLAAGVPAVMALIIAATLFWAQSALNASRERVRISQDIVRAVNELNGLFHSYALHHEERPKQQILAQQNVIQDLLGRVEFKTPEEQELVEEIRRSGHSMRATFLRVAMNYQRLEKSEDDRAAREAEQVLVGQLLARARGIVFAALRLETLANDQVAATRRKVAAFVLALIFTTTIPLTLLLTTMMKGIRRSLESLRRGTEIIAGGNLSHRLRAPCADELGELAGAFDAMAQRLEETTVSSEALRKEVEERKRTEFALHEAQAKLRSHAEALEHTVARRTVKLQETIDELEHFSYAIVHDLRAPLRAMQGFATLVDEECGPKPNTDLMKEYVRRIRTAANRMDQLITDALSYSKTAHGDFTLEPVDLQALVDDIMATYPNLRPDHVQVFIERPLPVVLGSPSGLTQCLSNLFGNAVKFARPGVKPRIRVWSEDYLDASLPVSTTSNGVRLWVEDNGIGIPLQSQELIFGMFQRAHTEYEGTGIGLAIVRKVVRRMGGEVGVVSEEGKGSRFWVTLKRPQ